MKHLLTAVRTALVAGLGAVAAGCASIPADVGTNPADPWERYNRHMFEFNDTIDRNVLKPVAEGYEQYVPQPARDCVSNIFSNIRDLPISLNNLLQGKPVEAVSDLGRVVINSIAGVFGCFDVASGTGLRKHNEDFGQTFGRWGAGPGPYFVLPLLGPSSVRDAVGRVPDTLVSPQRQIGGTNEQTGIYVVDLLDTRAGLLPAERTFTGVALDRYQFIRDAYLQRRRSLVFDGNPPQDELPTYDDPDDDPPAAAPVSPKNKSAGGDQPK